MQSQQWFSVVDNFSRAPFEDGAWLDALGGLALTTGSRIGQLIGLGSANAAPLNWVTELDQEYLDDFLKSNGADPSVNPILRAGTSCDVLQVRSSAEFISAEERRRNTFINTHMRRFDIQHICLTPLVLDRDMLVGLAVIRSSSQGEITPHQRQLFAAIAPHVRAAVRTQITLEHQGALLVAGAMEALSLPVFVCDRHGRVQSLTPEAEALVEGAEHPLNLKNNQLNSNNIFETRQITNAVAKAADGVGGMAPACTTLVLGQASVTGADPLVLEIVSMPRRDFSFGFEPRVLVVARQRQDPNRVKMLLQAVYRLTAAEVDVALHLVSGLTPEAIAAQRKSSVGTVRVQIRSIYEKVGVHRVTELAVRVNQLR